MEKRPPPSPPADWLPSLATLHDVTVVLLHIAAVGQTVFVILWMTLPWWRQWVGRALMVKSTALMLFLDYALLDHYVRLQPWKPMVTAVLFSFVTVGILSQVAAIGYEMLRASLDRRAVYSTDPRADDAGEERVTQLR